MKLGVQRARTAKPREVRMSENVRRCPISAAAARKGDGGTGGTGSGPKRTRFGTGKGPERVGLGSVFYHVPSARSAQAWARPRVGDGGGSRNTFRPAYTWCGWDRVAFA